MSTLPPPYDTKKYANNAMAYMQMMFSLTKEKCCRGKKVSFGCFNSLVGRM